ncbi:GTPase IMAP family member 9-like [Hoplias malabaricus]|uniref:GTPase IMAP family member 9-like n=1 Tax=Hoplias malabaricus TaxID=27720 RepID=UPI003462EB1A
MEIRIVLLGKGGAGKSSSGNTLLGRKSFHTAPSSQGVTQACSMSSGTVDGHKIFVVDTPGWTDFSQTENETIQKIVSCIEISDPGPHVLLFVLAIGRFTKEEIDTAKQILEVFGEEAIKHTMVLFTKGDDLEEKTIEEYLEDAHPGLKNIIRMCGGRYHSFNNRDKDNHEQVSTLLKKIKDMVETNKGKYFTKTLLFEKQNVQTSTTKIIIEIPDVGGIDGSKGRQKEKQDIYWRGSKKGEEKQRHLQESDRIVEGTSAVYLNQAINNSKQEHTYLEHGEQSPSQMEKLENHSKELLRMKLKWQEEAELHIYQKLNETLIKVKNELQEGICTLKMELREQITMELREQITELHKVKLEAYEEQEGQMDQQNRMRHEKDRDKEKVPHNKHQEILRESDEKDDVYEKKHSLNILCCCNRGKEKGKK